MTKEKEQMGLTELGWEQLLPHECLCGLSAKANKLPCDLRCHGAEAKWVNISQQL